MSGLSWGVGEGGGDNLGVFYYFSAFEFWPDKRGWSFGIQRL